MLISLVLTASFANASDCSDYSGQAFGLCNAYCEATDCDDNPNANQQACDNLYSLFEAATGEAPPCEITEYDVRTVYSGDDSIEVFVNGVALRKVDGTSVEHMQSGGLNEKAFYVLSDQTIRFGASCFPVGAKCVISYFKQQDTVS